MRNRLTKILLAGAAIAVLAAPVGAQARQGADDPVGHARHAAHSTTATKSTSSSTRTRHRHGRPHARRADDHTEVRGRGADDATAERRGRGTDDGPNRS